MGCRARGRGHSVECRRGTQHDWIKGRSFKATVAFPSVDNTEWKDGNQLTGDSVVSKS